MQIPSLRNPHINPLCVQAALAQVTGGPNTQNQFRFCDGERIVTKDYEPCASSNYVKMVHHSFELVATCLKDYVSESQNPRVQSAWVENYFRILTKESGLQANAVRSNQSAIGVAQLTRIYRQDFRKESLRAVRNHLANSESPYCRSLGDFAVSERRVVGLNRTCHLINVDSGPLVGFLVGFSHLRHVRRQVLTTLDRHSNLLSGLSASNRLRLELALVTISYNIGFIGLTEPLEYTLGLYRNRKQKITDSDQLVDDVISNLRMRKDRSAFSYANPKWISLPSSAESDRTREMMNYYNNIEQRFDQVLKTARRLQREQFPDQAPLRSCLLR